MGLTVPPERWAALLAYCRIEPEELGEEDRALLEIMYWSAVGYMTGAGVSAPAAGTPRRAQYDLCVNALVLDDWDRRGASAGERDAVENLSFRQLLNQLKRTEPLPDFSGGCVQIGHIPGERR